MATTTLPYTPPLQALPPWLSYSTFITTTGATAVITQTVVNLPLTYYGPPVSLFDAPGYQLYLTGSQIPLGTDGVWVYGGLTSPAPTSTASASATASASGSTTAGSTTTPISNTIPTSSSAPSSSVLPSSTTPFSTTPSNTASSSSSPAVTPTSPVAQQSSDHTVLPTWAILLIAIIGGLAVGVGLLLLYAMCWRRRERSSVHPDDTDDEITHSGARFRLLQALPIPRSLRSSMHRHSRVPQSDLEADAHPNHSDWQLVDPAPPMPTTMRNVPSGSGAGVAYGPIIPYRDDEEASDHPPTPASHQTHSSVSQGVLPRVGTNSGSSNASLFFNPRRDNEFAYVAPAPGEVLDRDPRVFPDRYSHMHDATTSMPIVPLAPPPFHSRSRSNTTRTEITQGMDSQRTKVNVGPAPLMAYPDSPVSEVDESAGLLPGLDAAALGLMSGSGRSSRAASPTHTPDRRSPTIVQRLSGLFKRLSGSGPSPTATAMGTTTPFMNQASPSHQAPQMKEQHPGMLGLGFLSAPPVIASASTRRTHGTADRPMSTISGNTVYHDAHSRPESPYVDAPPLYGTPTDELPLPDLDEPAPRSLRYPPGLTPTEALFLQNRGSRRVSAGLEELEEEDIVGDLRPVGPGAGRVGVEEGMYDVPAPGAEPGWASLAKGKQRAEEEEEADDGEPSARVRKRATLGEPMHLAAASAARSPTSSHFPGRSGSHSTGSHSGTNSSSSRSRRTGGSSISSASLRRLQQSSGSGQDPVVLGRDDMPALPRHRRAGGPLLSATFGPPSGWLRSRTPSGQGTPRSGRSSHSHSHGKSKSRSGSQPSQSHGQTPSHSPPASPPPPDLRTVASFLSTARSVGGTTVATTAEQGGASIRYVPVKKASVDPDADADEELRFPLPLQS